MAKANRLGASGGARPAAGGSRAGAAALIALVCGLGCLEPDDEGAFRPPEAAFGPRDLRPEDAASVEDTTDFDPSLRTTRIVRLRGFAGGSTVAFWRMNGAFSTAIVPVFRLVGPNGPIGLPIVDVLPGDAGYSPLWRLHRVPTTAAYDGVTIWSRAAIEAGVEAGLLLDPEPTPTVFLATVVPESLRFETRTGARGPTPIWFRGRRAAWVRFAPDLPIDLAVRRLEPAASHLLRRIDQPFALDEDREGFDLDGDGRLVSTHEVLPGSGVACRRFLVRTVPSLRSIDGLGPADVRSADDPAFTRIGQPPLLDRLDLGEVAACPREAP